MSCYKRYEQERWRDNVRIDKIDLLNIVWFFY